MPVSSRPLRRAPPARVVGLLPSLTETVCALDACDRLVAVDRYSNWPQAVQKLRRSVAGSIRTWRRSPRSGPTWC
jgi:ABC-type hemin transport system substrate-binding protein